MRRDGGAEATEAGDFVFDDRIVKDLQPPAAELVWLRTDTAENAPAGDPELASGGAPLDGAAMNEPPYPLQPEIESGWQPPPKSRRSSFRRFRLLGGALLLGAAFLAAKRGFFSADRTDAIPPPAPPATLAPPVIAPVPKQPARARSARAVAKPTPAPVRPQPPPVDESAVVPAVAAASPVDQSEETRFALAEEFLRAGDENRAEALYRRLLAEGTQQGRAALALGDLFAGRNDFDRALEFYRTSKQLFLGQSQTTASP